MTMSIFALNRSKLSPRHQLLCGALLVAIVWFGNFFEFDRFSIYADDISYLGGIFFFQNTFQTYWHNIPVFSDGRPIQYGLIDLTGGIIKATDSFGPAYLFLFALTAASVLATWRALTCRFSNEVAVTAAALLALSPLVSVRAFLNGIASPMALLLMMIAAMLYVSRWRVLAYLVSALILLSYELTFPVFALLPTLLRPLRSRRDIYGLIGHILICVAMVAGYSVVKTHLGSERVEDALAGHGPVPLLVGVFRATFRSCVFGVLGNFDLPLWLRAIVSSVSAIAWGIWAFFGFAALLFGLAARRVVVPEASPAEGRGLIAVQTIAVLLLMILAGYSLVYFGNVNGARQVQGRGSRFHSVAALPWSILGALLFWWLIDLTRRPWARRLVIGSVAAYFAVIFAFSVSHQDDFVKEAERQRMLVTQLLLDHPRMDPKATFVVEEPLLSWRELPSIEYEDWHSFYSLLPNLFDFGPDADGRRGPAIRLVMGEGWPQMLKLGADNRVEWSGGMWPPDPEMEGHIWAYRFSVDGKLTPNPGPILVGGQDILHHGQGNSGDGLVNMSRAKRQPLFHLLMGPEAAIVDAALRRRENEPP